MSENPNKPAWRQPILIEPAQLLSPESKTQAEPQPARPAQELPLESVYPVEENVEEPASVAAADGPQPASRHKRLAKLFAALLALLLGFGVCAELYRLLDWSFSLHWLLGSAASALVAGTVGCGLWWVRSSLAGLRQLQQANHLRGQGEALLDKRSQGEAAGYLHRLQQQYRHTPVAASLNHTIHEVDSAYNDGEIIRFVAQRALAEQDEQAYQRVTQYSLESAVLVGVSPYASFDMLLVGWRNLRLLNDVAAIYGIPPGLPAQWKLLKQVLGNIAFAGLSEMTIDAGSSLLGSSLTTTLSARFGQGLGAGLITARIGLQAMQLCRPLPEPENKPARLQAIQQRLLAQIKKLATDQKTT